MNVVIIGATGLVGTELIKKMTTDERIKKIWVITRRNLETKSPKISEIIIKDLSEISSLRIEDQNAVFISALGTTIKIAGSQENFRKVDYVANLDFAKLAKTHNAQKYILVSSVGAYAKSRAFYTRVKGQLEEAVLELGLRSVVIYRPGMLIGDRICKRFIEEVLISIIKLASKLVGDRAIKPFATSVDTLVISILTSCFDSFTGYIEAWNFKNL